MSTSPPMVSAVEKVDDLLGTVDERANEYVGGLSSQPPPAQVDKDEVVITPAKPPHLDAPRSESGSSSAPNEHSSDQRHETGGTSLSDGSTRTVSMPITDLERRLSTKRTLDIFTMKLRSVRLAISPPQLTFTRSLRFSIDAVISFTPRATGREVVCRHAHIFLLSDLLLVCERMTDEERVMEEVESANDIPQGGGPDMWLMFPPFTGKALRVAGVPGQDNMFSILILRKETLYIQVESAQAKKFMVKMVECIFFANSVGPASKNPPPPMPPSLAGSQAHGQRQATTTAPTPFGVSTTLTTASDGLAS